METFLNERSSHATGGKVDISYICKRPVPDIPKSYCSKELPNETEARTETELEMDKKASMKTIDNLRTPPGSTQLLTCGSIIVL